MAKDFQNYTGLDGSGWQCDFCGEAILKAGNSWLQWIEVSKPKRHGRDLSLVHHLPASPNCGKREAGCQFDQTAEFAKDNGIVMDTSGETVCGHDGLVYLLSLTEDERLPLPDLLYMVQRFHVPGFERARHHFQAAILEGVIEPNLPDGFHRQHDINAVLKWAEKQRK